MLKAFAALAAVVIAGRAFAGAYSDAISVRGDTVEITESAARHIKGEGLSAILMQAAATPIFKGGEQIGYRLTDMDPGSVFETVGIQDGDLVLEIDGMPLSDPRRSVEILRYAKTLDAFDVLLVRRGVKHLMHVSVR